MAEIGTDIEKAKQLIDSGELVAIPTDTVYGLAGDVMNESALARIFEVKNRPPNVPLIALSDSVEKLQTMAKEFSIEENKLARKFWPGALTIIVDKLSSVSDLMTAGLTTIGLRIPAHPLAINLLNKVNRPLAVTSANIHGEPSPKNALEVDQQIGDKISYILDGGDSKVGEESTIVRIESSKIKIYREGALSLELLQQALSS